MLTKSHFLAGRQCLKRLYFATNCPELAASPSASDQVRMKMGQELGVKAHELFPQGTLVSSQFGDQEFAAKETQRLISEGFILLFEATFITPNQKKQVRCDVLEKTADGWVLTEVKSSTKVKDEHFDDLAFQVSVLRECGLEVIKAQICHVNTSAVKAENPLTARELFEIEDITHEVFLLVGEIEREAQVYLEMLDTNVEPNIRTNLHCTSPVKCPFYDHCHKDISPEDLTFLPGIRRATVTSFRQDGIETISDLPAGAKLTKEQTWAIAAIRFNTPYLDEDLAIALEKIKFPAHFIDFEAASSAIPLYKGLRPYQAFPFQWSDHVLENPTSEAKHIEFLTVDPIDPREAFTKTLLETLRTAETVVFYSSYELTTVRALVKEGFDGAKELLEILESKGFDLLKVIKSHTYFAEYKGSYSIKKVLPAIVSGLSYKDLNVQDGDAAVTEYLRMIRPETSEAEKTSIAKNLLDYCERDTLAMVELYRALNKLAH